MTKSQLIERLGAKLGITISDSERFVNSFIYMIYEELRKGRRVQISGFGTFSVSHRMPRLGVNPRDWTKKITIPELNTPKFKAGERFKDAIKLK